jgi:glycosyltransferase involved in cell wall biosynthesis
MRIGINLIPLRPGQMGGHEFYVRRLVNHLLAHNRHHQYVVFTAPWNDDSLDFQQGRYRKILVRGGRGSTDDVPMESRRGCIRDIGRWTLPWAHRWASRPARDLHEWVRRLRLQLWFCPMTDLDPRHLPIPTVVTIADIQQEYYPQFFTRAELQERALMYSPSCQEATAVVAVSDFSKRCLIEKYDLSPDKVHRVYEAGVERDYDAADLPTPEDVRCKHHLPVRYALYPANMWPHKNHQLLLLTLHRLRQVYGVALSLVLTGAEMGQGGKFEALVRHFRLQEQVRHLGYVAADDLPGLYRGAAMLLFPSLYEGFGIPLIEAMALGCPIAAGNTASIPEVVGDAALLFDPRYPDSIAAVCAQLLADAELRQTLIARGRERAARFSWERAANETLQVFEWARAQHIAVRPESTMQRYRIEGVYRDGWAARKVRVFLPDLPELRSLKIEGFSDHLPYPLTLRMKVDGKQVQELSISNPGKFMFVGEFIRSRRRVSGVQIEVTASKDFTPTAIEKTLDSRRLAYHIEKLWLVCAHGPEIPLYSPSRAS